MTRTGCLEILTIARYRYCCPRAIRVDVVKVMSATYGYNTKPADREAGGPASDRLMATDDSVAKAVLEPKENV